MYFWKFKLKLPEIFKFNFKNAIFCHNDDFWRFLKEEGVQVAGIYF